MLCLAQVDALSLLANPRVFAVGAAAATLPILIHLFNRRRFKVVDWAAMEFLLAANKQNRRRLKIEDFALLALRCLALFLIGTTLARPFLPASTAVPLVPAENYELVLLLDNSLSMRARFGADTAWDAARRAAQNLIASLARNGGTHSFTLLLTSQPHQPVIAGQPLTQEALAELSDRLAALTCSSLHVPLGDVLKSLADQDETQRKNHRRLVYLLTDLRQADWQLGENSPADSGLVHSLGRIAGAAQSCTVLDAAVAPDQLAADQNLSLVAVQAEGLLLAGAPASLDVSLKNQGTQPARAVRVSLRLPGALPVDSVASDLLPQQTTQVRFPLFAQASSPQSGHAQLAAEPITLALTAADQGYPDSLAEDDVAFFPALWTDHVSVLLVDGDAGNQEGAGESYFLDRALNPSGPVASGLRTTIVHPADLSTVDLSAYQVIFLLNCDQLSESPLAFASRLQSWVQRGGGLVFMPGDRVDARVYNDLYWREGKGLSPLGLSIKRGNAQHATWTRLQVTDPGHPLLGRYQGQDNPLFDSLQIYQWWALTETALPLDSRPTVACRLTDPDRSPLLSERSFGQGNVILFAIPADLTWSNWPSDPSYLLVMQDLVRFLAASQAVRRSVEVGQSLVEEIDIARFQLEGELTGPGADKLPLTADKLEIHSKDAPELRWQLKSPATKESGFYKLGLTSRDGTTQSRLFAANVSPQEGDLRRVDTLQLQRNLAAVGVNFASTADPSVSDVAGNRREVSPIVLWFAVAALAGEQLLGWWWGRRRI